MWPLLLLLIALVALKIAAKNAGKYRKVKGYYSRKQNTNTKYNDFQEIKPTDKRDYTRSYQRKFLLTQNEYYAYHKLKEILDKYEMVICPKVRLLDLIEPIKGDHYKGALGKVQSKHVDFVICDKNLYVKGILELDDNSHNLPERQERDKFVDAALRNVGYKVIHVRAVTEETIKELLPIREYTTEQ